MVEFIHCHPYFCPLQAPELPAVQAYIIKCPQQPPREKVLPKLSESAQWSMVAQDSKSKVLHQACSTGVIRKRKEN